MSIPEILRECQNVSGKGRLKNNPCKMYLETLAESGKRSMRSQLKNALILVRYDGSPEMFPWEKLRYIHLVNLRSVMLGAGKSPSSINTTLAAIKGVMYQAFNIGMLSAEDYLKLQSIKRVRYKKSNVGRSLTVKETQKLLALFRRQQDIVSSRDEVIIALLLTTGLRRTELTSLDKESYDEKNGVLIIKKIKGGGEKEVLVTSKLKVRLRKYLNARGRFSGPLFSRVISGNATEYRLSGQSIYNIVKSRTKQAGIAVCTPHDLRRTFVSQLLDKGIDISTVRKIVGHASVNTTAMYDKRPNAEYRSIIQKSLCM